MANLAAVTVVNMHEAKTRLSELVARAEGGEEVVIARAGVAAVRLVPVERTAPRRTFGWLVGVVDCPPDDVLMGEDPDVVALFEGDASDPP